MRTQRLLILAAVTLMSFALAVAVACGADTQPAAQDGQSDGIVHSDTIEPEEPETSSSIGMPAPDSENADEMIVVLHDALNINGNSYEAPITDGEAVGGVGPVSVTIADSEVRDCLTDILGADALDNLGQGSGLGLEPESLAAFEECGLNFGDGTASR